MQLPSVDDFEEEEDGDQVFHLDRIENQQQQKVNEGIENNTNNETIDEVQVEMDAQRGTVIAEAHQVLEVLLGFAGEPHDQRGAQHRVG